MKFGDGLDEEDFQNGGLPFFQQGTAGVLLLGLELDMSCVTMQNRWNNRISDGWVYAQIRKGLGMHLVTYSNHDTVPFLLIVPIKGPFV